MRSLRTSKESVRTGAEDIVRIWQEETKKRLQNIYGINRKRINIRHCNKGIPRPVLLPAIARPRGSCSGDITAMQSLLKGTQRVLPCCPAAAWDEHASCLNGTALL